MPEPVPKGWVKGTLGEITWPSRSRAQPTEVLEMRYVGLEHIEGQTMRLLGYGEAHKFRSASLRFSQGDVLYGRMRPYLNKVWVAEFDGICSGEFLVFSKHDWLNNRFLASRLNADDFVKFAEERVSGDRPRVSFQKLVSFPLLLPPTAEQDRIVARLDAAMSRLRKGEAATRRALRRVDDYRTAVLRAAVTGQLSQGWRQRRTGRASESGAALLHRLLDAREKRWKASELQKLSVRGKSRSGNDWESRYRQPAPPRTTSSERSPEGWTWASIDQLSWASGYGTSIKCTYDADGPPVLRIPNVRHRQLDTHDLKFATRSQRRPFDFVEPGDMLLIRTNGSKSLTGRAVVVATPLARKITFASYLIRYRLVGEKLLWSWIALAWDSNVLRSSIEGRAKTTAGQYNLSLSGLADVPLPLPPFAEQRVIVDDANRRLLAADKFTTRLDDQLAEARRARSSILRKAFLGSLVPQDPRDQPASVILEQATAEKTQPTRGGGSMQRQRVNMRATPRRQRSLTEAWNRIGKAVDARQLFDEAGFESDEVVQFYEVLRANPQVRGAFERASDRGRNSREPQNQATSDDAQPCGRFRLTELWLEEFKNLKDYTMRFDADCALNVILGWNGTGKSNLFEALVVIFRDLHDWSDRNRWPAEPMKGFRLVYELDDYVFQVEWQTKRMKRPSIRRGPKPRPSQAQYKTVGPRELGLPRFVFGYYAGPTNRLAEHFLPMKQAHYDRLREASVDDAETLARLLEQRRFFCAETHHAKYVLLAFSYREDPHIKEFLATRLRIVGFESALFVVRKPRWAKAGSKASAFWGATGIMRRVVERLRRHAVAPMVLEQKVNYGYRSTTEDHYYFYLPDVDSLQAFAAEYPDARTFFLALESTDFSELIHDVKIQVRIKPTDGEELPITFRQLSEGEQQLLMVLGLMRFTQSRQSLVLLDEPDTHLNPHWSVDYLKDLRRVMSPETTGSVEQQTSQILIATHDPLIIGSLVKQQVHLLTRDSETGGCTWIPASVDPRGLGVTGILTSEMFGFRSDLDEPTLRDLDRRVRLAGKEGDFTPEEEKELGELDSRLERTGFLRAFSDPYYSAFVRAWARRYSEVMAGSQSLVGKDRETVERISQEVLAEAIAEVEKSSGE